MSPLFLTVSFFVLSTSLASDVIEFTSDSWADGIKEHDIVLVEFYAPWCGHCKRLAPEYEKAATKLKSNDPPIPIAKVDCTSEKDVCDKYGVTGFPTLKIFRSGEFSAEYSGPRESDGIIKYMRGQVGPSSRELKTLKDFEKFTSSDDYSVIGVFEKETRLRDSYHKVADTERDRFRFAHTSEKEILEKLGGDDDIFIVAPKRLNNKFEENTLKYTGNYDTEKIKKFIEQDMTGLCGHRSHDNLMQFKKPLLVAYYNVDYVKDPKGTNYWRNRVLKTASEFKKKDLYFAVSNADEFNNEIEEHGLNEQQTGDKPVVSIHGANGEKFPMTTEFSVDNLKEFVQKYLDGKIDQHLKSEEVPDNSENNVKIVVAKNFDEIVNADSDVLIEFYAPWCGHCKKLAPIYDDLGDKLKDEDVIIAKMDATANDVPTNFNVRGFPTIFWVPKGKKKSPVPYNGGRDLDDFFNFIAKESTDGLKGFDRSGKPKKGEL